MSHGAAACASRLMHIGNPLPAVATDSITARQTARRAVGVPEKRITILDKANTRDGRQFLVLRQPRLPKPRSLRERSAAASPARLADRREPPEVNNRLHRTALLGSKKKSHLPAISRRRFRAEAQDVLDRPHQVSG